MVCIACRVVEVPPWCPCVLQHLRGADQLHGAHRREARLLLAQPAGGRVLRGRAQAILQELLPVGPGPARPPERRAVSLHRAARAGHPADDGARGVEEQTQRGHRVGSRPARTGTDSIAPAEEPEQQWVQGRTGCPASPSRSPRLCAGLENWKGKKKQTQQGVGRRNPASPAPTHVRAAGLEHPRLPLSVLFWVSPHVGRHLLPCPSTRTGTGWGLAGRGEQRGERVGLTGNGNKVLFLPK